jgi:hypothetical protein
MEAAHSISLRDYALFTATEHGVKSFLQTIIDEIWYKDLKDPMSFYNTVTAHELLSHLDDNCGGLHPVELINVPTEMIGFYAASIGIPEYYIKSTEEAQRKLARASPHCLLLSESKLIEQGARNDNGQLALPPKS